MILIEVVMLGQHSGRNDGRCRTDEGLGSSRSTAGGVTVAKHTNILTFSIHGSMNPFLKKALTSGIMVLVNSSSITSLTKVASISPILLLTTTVFVSISSQVPLRTFPAMLTCPLVLRLSFRLMTVAPPIWTRTWRGTSIFWRLLSNSSLGYLMNKGCNLKSISPKSKIHDGFW